MHSAFQLIDRLMRMTQMLPEAPGCWIFMGSLSGGYGKIGGGSGRPRMLWAHRVSYEFYRGPIPAGMEIDHVCRVRCCVNPTHLELVTSAENARRSHPYSLGPRMAQTHCKFGHPFDASNTYIYHGRRYCRLCHNDNCKRYRRDDGMNRRAYRRRAA